MEKLSCGIDIHKEKLAGCIMNTNGEVTREHIFPFSRRAIEQFLCGIPNSGIAIATEACGIWRGVYKILTELGFEVKLADPKKLMILLVERRLIKLTLGYLLIF